MDNRILFFQDTGTAPPLLIEQVVVDEKEQRINIYVGHEPGIQFRRPECGKFYGMYDHAPERVYRHLNTCQMKIYIHVRPPRVNCLNHGVKQIDPEFGENSSGMTFALESFVIQVAQERSVEATARLCGLSWGRGWDVLGEAVARGQARKVHRIPSRIGVDEKSMALGHKYESLVCDIDAGTVEFVKDGRGQQSLESYYRRFSSEELAGVKTVATDMWHPYSYETHMRSYFKHWYFGATHSRLAPIKKAAKTL